MGQVAPTPEMHKLFNFLILTFLPLLNPLWMSTKPKADPVPRPQSCSGGDTRGENSEYKRGRAPLQPPPSVAAPRSGRGGAAGTRLVNFLPNLVYLNHSFVAKLGEHGREGAGEDVVIGR